MILLDTHVLAWLTMQPEKLSGAAASATARAEGLALVTRDDNILSSPLLRTIW